MMTGSSSQARLDAPKPEGVEVVRDGLGLTISYRWSRLLGLGMLVFAGVWDAFLFNWYRVAWKQGVSSMSFWFPLIHVGAGLWITYFAIANLMNRTVVNVDGRTLTVKLGPLPWRGNRTVECFEIKQLYCEERLSRGRTGFSGSHQLSAVLSGDRKVTLLAAVPGADVALYLEQQLEKQLGIEDQPVTGEMRK